MGLSVVNTKVWAALAIAWAMVIVIRALRSWWWRVKNEYRSGLAGSDEPTAEHKP